MRACAPASRFLHSILTTPSVLRDRVPVFIACNKSDRMNALSPEFIRKRLEKEMWVPVRMPAPARIRHVGSPSLTPDAHASLSSSLPNTRNRRLLL